MIVCATCNDSHTMTLRGRVVPCTRCPTPCEACRSRTPGFGPGAYCVVPMCTCTCHSGDPRLAAARVSAAASESNASNPAPVDIEATRYNRIEEALAAGLDGMGLHLASGDQCLPLDEDQAKIAIAGLARVVGLVL